MKNNKTRRLVSRREAAEILQCSQQTVSNWVKSGILNGHKVNDMLFVDANTLDALLDTGKDIEKAKNDVGKLFVEINKTRDALQNELDVKRESLRLYKTSVISRIARGVVIDAIGLFCDVLTKSELEVLTDLVEYGDAELTSKKLLVNERDIVKIANSAYKKIHTTAKRNLVDENKRLKENIARLQRENLDLKTGGSPSSNDNSFLEKSIDECWFTVRCLRILDVMGIKTVGDLANTKLSDIAKYRNAGKKTIREIEEFLVEHGISPKR